MTLQILQCTRLTPTVRRHQNSRPFGKNRKEKSQDIGAPFGSLKFSEVMGCPKERDSNTNWAAQATVLQVGPTTKGSEVDLHHPTIMRCSSPFRNQEGLEQVPTCNQHQLWPYASAKGCDVLPYVQRPPPEACGS